MNKKLAITLLSALALFSGSLAHAKKDGMPNDPNTGGKSPQHMGQSGQTNTNSPTLGQEKGAIRADDRKSDQGLMHDNDGKKDHKGKAKGHNK